MTMTMTLTIFVFIELFNNLSLNKSNIPNSQRQQNRHWNQKIRQKIAQKPPDCAIVRMAVGESADHAKAPQPQKNQNNEPKFLIAEKEEK